MAFASVAYVKDLSRNRSDRPCRQAECDATRSSNRQQPIHTSGPRFWQDRRGRSRASPRRNTSPQTDGTG